MGSFIKSWMVSEKQIKFNCKYDSTPGLFFSDLLYPILNSSRGSAKNQKSSMNVTLLFINSNIGGFI